jgi:hypothetical protein
MIAALANAASDVVLQGTQSGSYSADMRFMWEISEQRLRWGANLGVAVIPFAVAGFWHAYQGLKVAGRWAALPPVLIGSYVAAVGCAFHFSLAYPALVGHAIIDAGGSSRMLEQLYEKMNELGMLLSWVVPLGFAVFSVWFMALVLTGKTKYPKWFGLLNPLFLMIAMAFATPLIPHLGSYLTPASSALSFAVFFAISTPLLWTSDA